MWTYRHSDTTRERFWHIAIPQFVTIIGFIIAISTMDTAARYVSFFLMVTNYIAFICIFAWTSNSFPRPPAKRAVALALTNAVGQMGSLAGSYIWPKETFGPTYRYIVVHPLYKFIKIVVYKRVYFRTVHPYKRNTVRALEAIFVFVRIIGIENLGNFICLKEGMQTAPASTALKL
jgi:hypothetical protein